MRSRLYLDSTISSQPRQGEMANIVNEAREKGFDRDGQATGRMSGE